MWVYIYVCVCVRMSVCVYVCTHTYTFDVIAAVGLKRILLALLISYFYVGFVGIYVPNLVLADSACDDLPHDVNITTFNGTSHVFFLI